MMTINTLEKKPVEAKSWHCHVRARRCQLWQNVVGVYFYSTYQVCRKIPKSISWKIYLLPFRVTAVLFWHTAASAVHASSNSASYLWQLK